jgi:hypothetical protein
MIRIEVELSAPVTEWNTLAIAGWVAESLNRDLGDHVEVHRISIEREDA